MAIRISTAGVILVSVTLVVLSSPAAFAANSSAQTHTVPADADVFAAGSEKPPDLPGGSGTVPPSVALGGADTVTFPAITGQIQAGSSFPETGPDGYTRGEIGDRELGTDITSYRGISGVVHKERSLFVVGVFLSDETPVPPAPERRNFTEKDSFERLSPETGQVFFIGDGRTDDGTVQKFTVPEGATRLYIGFADGNFFTGKPGYYSDNSGELNVTVDTSSTPNTTTGGSGPGFGVAAALVGVVLLAVGRKR